MTDLVAASLAARRLAALAILALLLWAASPLLLLPLAGFRERAEAIETETAWVDRLERLEERQRAVAALAGHPNPPFILAADAEGALEALRARLAAAATPETLRIESLSPLPREEKPGAPVALQASFSATEAGLYAALADLETRAPFVRVRELSVKSGLDAQGARVIGGHLVLSAVPYLTGAP